MTKQKQHKLKQFLKKITLNPKSIGGKFIALGLILIFVFMAIGYISIFSIGEGIIEKRLQEQLTSVSELKTNSINYFFERAKENIVHIVRFDLDMDMVNPILLDQQDDDAAIEAEEAKLTKLMGSYSSFNEFFILDLEGKVVVSTIPSDIGKYRDQNDFFKRGLLGTYISKIFYDISLGEPTMTVSQPIALDSGEAIGVFVARINLNRISTIMQDYSGLGETGETYLVNEFTYIVSDLRLASDSSLKKAIYTEPIKECLELRETTPHFKSDYLNYNGEEVIGVHSWIGTRNLCIISEMSSVEALESIDDLRESIAFLSFIIAVSFVISFIILSRRITKPIIALQKSADQISKGKLNEKIKINTDDEVGDLAAAFDNMRKKVKRSHTNLEAEVYNQTKELKHANEDIALMLKTKTEFLNRVSHDLRTPLTPIKLLLDIVIKDKTVPKGPKDQLKVVKRNVNNLSYLVTDVLSLVRLESPKHKMEKKYESLEAVIKEFIIHNQVTYDSEHIKVSTRFAKHVPKVMLDKNKFFEVLGNLVSNAIKHFDKRTKTLLFAVDVVKKNVVFTLQDNGEGIDPRQIKFIFDEFFKIDEKHEESTGLGLTICRNIIAAHNGKIWAESQGKTKGTSIKISFPIHINTRRN